MPALRRLRRGVVGWPRSVRLSKAASERVKLAAAAVGTARARRSTRARRPTRRCFGMRPVNFARKRLAMNSLGSVAPVSPLSVGSSLILTATDSYTRASRVAQLQAELSNAMNRVTRELRWIGIDQTSAPPIPLINSVTSTSITWNTNYSITLASGELRYTPNGGAAVVLGVVFLGWSLVGSGRRGGAPWARGLFLVSIAYLS